jgi:DNA repair photolyase
VDIATSISTFDESVRKVIEPGAASTLERLEMLRTFSGICHSTTVGFMPIIPLLSDTDENLDTAFRLTKEFGLDNIITNFLFLRGDVKSKFMKTIQTHFHEIYYEFSKLYNGSTVDNQYMDKTSMKINTLRRKYELFDVFRPVELPKSAIQLSLF